MSLIQSAATALPKRHIARWLVPTCLTTSFTVLPQSKTTGRHSRTLSPRHYATRTRAPATRVKIPRAGPLFSVGDVPPLKLFETQIKMLEVDDLTAEDCYRAADVYCEIAVGNLSTWKGQLERDYGIDNYTLHYTALCLLNSNTNDQSIFRLAVHMLKTASELEYAPSTKTLLSMLMDRQYSKRGPGSVELLEATLPQLEKLVRSGTDLDALTLKGMALNDQQKPREALSYFDRAIRVAAHKEQAAGGSPTTTDEVGNTAVATPAATGDAAIVTVNPSAVRAPRWSLEPRCYLERGRLLWQLGQKKEAEKALKVAAYELDLADAYWELANILETDTPEYEYCLLKCAISRNPNACAVLANLEAAKAASTNPSDIQKREDHEIKGAEWVELARMAWGDNTKKQEAR